MKHHDTPMSSEWLRRMADAEDRCGGAVSVGGLAHHLGLLKTPSGHVPLKETALGKLVEFARRKADMDIETLAKRADIELADLVALEQGGVVAMEPRTVFQLCQVLKLPVGGVMELAGPTLIVEGVEAMDRAAESHRAWMADTFPDATPRHARVRLLASQAARFQRELVEAVRKAMETDE